MKFYLSHLLPVHVGDTERDNSSQDDSESCDPSRDRHAVEYNKEGQNRGFRPWGVGCCRVPHTPLLRVGVLNLLQGVALVTTRSGQTPPASKFVLGLLFLPPAR